MPVNLGNSLVNSITKTVQATHTMTPAELDSYGEAEYTKLEHIYGTALEDKLRATGHMIEQLEATTPGLTNVLKSRGVGDNALVVARLIQAATGRSAKGA